MGLVNCQEAVLPLTYNVKAWLALGVMSLAAVKLMLMGAPDGLVGVPLSTPLEPSKVAHDGKPEAV